MRTINFILLSILLMPTVVLAASEDEIIERLDKKVMSILPGYENGNIRSTPVKGLYELLTNGRIAYISEDGEYLINGEIQKISDGKNVTAPRLAEVRMAALTKIDSTTLISFPAKNERLSLIVFTDVDCVYCRKLHNSIEEYNDIGVSINYMAFPREGIPSAAYNKLANVWCSDNRIDALTRAKSGETVVAKNTCKHPIADHYALGKFFRIQGTPAMILPDGNMLFGYISPDKLAYFLDK